MNKFLKLIEQSLPDEDKQLQYTVIEKIVNIFSKTLKSVPGMSVSAEYPDRFIIDIEGDKVVFAIVDMIDGEGDFIDEDGEDLSYKVDQEVEKLAQKASSGARGLVGRAFGTAPQKALAARKERDNVAAQGVDVYRQMTKDISTAIQQAKSRKNKINVI